MPLFPIPLARSGPLVDVGVSVSRSYAPWGGSPGSWSALIDTGADMTVISPGLVAALKPMRLGTQAVSVVRSILPYPSRMSRARNCSRAVFCAREGRTRGRAARIRAMASSASDAKPSRQSAAAAIVALRP
jgi:hypothetical protein